MVPDASLLARAADCYLRAGLPLDAARCYRDMGAYRAAAEIWEKLGALPDAARDYAAAGAHEQAAWILAHQIGDAPAARAELVEAEAEAEAAGQAPDQVAGPSAVARKAAARKTAELRLRLTRARCDVAENVARSETIGILGEAMEHLDHDVLSLDPLSIEQRAVAVAEAMGRPDLVALVFAAAVRGGRHQAAERWNGWSQRVLQVSLILPEPGLDRVLAGSTLAARPTAPGPGQT